LEVRILKELGHYYGELGESEGREDDGRFESLRGGLATSDPCCIIAYRYCLSINYCKCRACNQIAWCLLELARRNAVAQAFQRVAPRF
jgi:hypothetical protein